MNLTQHQQKVIQSFLNHKVTIVSAGAGSGKTHTVINAFLEVIEKQKANPGDFILITFTRAAAEELRGRLMKGLTKKLSSVSPAEKPIWRQRLQELSGAFIGTIHSFCREILSDYGYEVSIAHTMNVSFSQEHKKNAIHEAINANIDLLRFDPCKDTDHGNPNGDLIGKKASPLKGYELEKVLLHIYDTILNLSWDPNQILLATQQTSSAPQPYNAAYLRIKLMEILVDAHQRYQQKKKELALMDSNDMLLKAHDLFSSSSIGNEISKTICSRWKYLIVDEFQDTDEIQLKIIQQLLTHLNKLMVVGDRKQSIFGFRGANNTLLQRLATEVYTKNPSDIINKTPLPLANSARPTIELLEHINHVFEYIGCNTRGMDFSTLNQPLVRMDDVSFQALDNIPPIIRILRDKNNDTIDSIQVYLKHFLTKTFQSKGPKEETNEARTKAKKTIDYKDIVILARTNANANAIYKACNECTPPIPAVLVKGDVFYQTPIILDIYRLLQCVLEMPYLQGIHHLQGTIFDKNKDLAQIFQNNSASTLRTNLPKTLLENLEKLQQKSRELHVPELLWEIYSIFNLIEPLQAGTEEKEGKEISIQKITRNTRYLYRLHEIARTIFHKEHALSLEQFVDHLRLSIETSKTEVEPIQNTDNPPNKIRIMTIHTSKGLEFPIVLIPELERTLTQPAFIPHYFAKSHNFVFEDQGLEPASFHGKHCSPLRCGKNDPRITICSPTYKNKYELEVKPALLKEEMQILYVAMTRAKNQVVLLGVRKQHTEKRTSTQFCWQSEFDLLQWQRCEDYDKLDIS